MAERVMRKGFKVAATLTPIDEITPYEKNCKKHPAEQVASIAESIKKFGWDQPIVTDAAGVIIKGHGRYFAAKKLGLKEVPVVKRDDLSGDEARASRIADNQVAEAYWHYGNLVKELETSILEGADLVASGFSMEEIKRLCPGLIEDVEEFSQSVEGFSFARDFTGADGMVGESIPATSSGMTMSEWVGRHERVVVPVTGDLASAAALVWCADNGVPAEKVVAVDVTFGLRMWHTHRPYIKYLEEATGYTIKAPVDLSERFLGEVRQKGWPSRTSMYLFDQFMELAMEESLTDNKADTCLVWGIPKEEGKPQYRGIGVMPDSTVHYADPFSEKYENEIVEYLAEHDVLLNPMYKFLDVYTFPGSPVYMKKDFAFLKYFDLDLWCRWIVYFGQSRFCLAYQNSGEFNVQSLCMIAESIKPREVGVYAEYAMAVDAPYQAIRETIRHGDDYDDALGIGQDLPRLDPDRGPWWQQKEYSEGYNQCTSSAAETLARKGDKSWADHQRDAEQAAREAERANPSKDYANRAEVKAMTAKASRRRDH